MSKKALSLANDTKLASDDKKTCFQTIHALASEFSVSSLCELAKVSKSGYYKWKSSNFAPRLNDDLVEHIRAIAALRPYYGYRRITTELRKEGYAVNHKRVYRLMKQLGIQSTIRKKRKYYGRKGSQIFDNVLERDFSASKVGEKLVTDITYIQTQESFMYLSAVQDLYNNEIIAYNISISNNLPLVLETINQLPKYEQAILHSDQGFQYTHIKYAHAIKQHGLTGSHSRVGNCLDNACIESFFSHLKTELGPFSNFTIDESQKRIEEYILFYNTKRAQRRLKNNSPIEYRLQAA